MHELMTLIHWPDGSLWDNLISQLLASIVAGTITYFKLKRHHREHTDELLERLGRIEQHLNIPEPQILEIIEEQPVITPEPFKLVL